MTVTRGGKRKASTVITTPSQQRKSYIGIVIYWFNEDLTKNICILGCKKCIGKKDSIKVAKSIQSVLNEYGISQKCVGVNTDGGSEYQKAFHTLFTNDRLVTLKIHSTIWCSFYIEALI